MVVSTAFDSHLKSAKTMSIVVFVNVVFPVVSFGVEIKLKPRLEKASISSLVIADFVLKS